MQPKAKEIERIIKMSLTEDVGKGDITSNITIPEDVETVFCIRARHEMIACGAQIAALVFKTVSKSVNIDVKCKDGEVLNAGDIILEGQGNARAILAAERVALNLLRHMCGVSTLSNKFVQKVAGTKAKILDTRKTIPGLRSLQKYAVVVGGAQNHRYCLDDAILIKDNHISVCGGVAKAVKKAKDANTGLKIEVECDTLEQVKEALSAMPDIIMLDNMSLDNMRQAVQMVSGKVLLEASGNVNLDTVADIAKTGVDYISAGIITNCPVSVDIGLDIDF